MRIIDAIEINYFRSIYQAKLKNMLDYNVFVGGNDSGKSNILRALNIFFNNEISDFEDFDFLEDVTHSRQDEARDAKGRLTIWIRVTFNNVEGWKTLPAKFSVKKVWNRYADQPEISYETQNAASVTKFLNKIKFHYVPAVKTQDIYSYYLRSLYDSLSRKQDLDLIAPAKALSETVNGAVSSMSTRIQGATGVDSTINIPTNFIDIFERLSFSTQVGNYFVPLSRRGDGVQARHIPHILEYISENNGKNNIWGYEEPENSLELSNAFELAEQFASEFSESNQLFVTTHSPAFYGIDEGNTNKFYVEKVEYNDTSISKVSRLDDVHKVDGALGISRLITKKSQVLFEELRMLKSANDQLSELQRPAILTEGATDVEIIKEAQRRLFDGREPYEVICCENVEGGGGGHTNLKTLIESIPAKEHFKRLAIFDRDKGGTGSYGSLKNFEKIEDDVDIKIRSCRKVFALMLPDRDWEDEYFELAGRPVAIEQMFSPDVIGRELIKYKFQGAAGYLSRKQVDKLVGAVGLEEARAIVSAHVEVSDKKLAVRRIRRAPDAAFEAFNILFQAINRHVGNLS